MKGSAVFVDIEQEYKNYIYDGWQKFSDVTTDISGPGQALQHTYDAISQCSIQFLKEKLDNLEAQDNSS
jgi:hypothetical protein